MTKKKCGKNKKNILYINQGLGKIFKKVKKFMKN